MINKVIKLVIQIRIRVNERQNKAKKQNKTKPNESISIHFQSIINVQVYGKDDVNWLFICVNLLTNCLFEKSQPTTETAKVLWKSSLAMFFFEFQAKKVMEN